jgi:hypothetical protein
MFAGKIARRLIMAGEAFVTSLWMRRSMKSRFLVAMSLPLIKTIQASMLSQLMLSEKGNKMPEQCRCVGPRCLPPNGTACCITPLNK